MVVDLLLAMRVVMASPDLATMVALLARPRTMLLVAEAAQVPLVRPLLLRVLAALVGLACLTTSRAPEFSGVGAVGAAEPAVLVRVATEVAALALCLGLEITAPRTRAAVVAVLAFCTKDQPAVLGL